MKSKSKFIIALVLFGVVAIGAIAGIIAVVASFNANVEGNFKVSYTAQNVHATVSAGYVISETETSKPQGLTYTIINAGNDTQITFDAADEAEEVEKSFDGITLDIKSKQYIYFKYTFTHTGTEDNSMKFLNIALTKNFTQFENLTIEYAMESTRYSASLGLGNYSSWNSEINELTAVRDETNTINVYIRMYVTAKTKDAKLDGMLNWTLTGSDEYIYENAYITGEYLSRGLSNNSVSATSVTFDYLDEDTESIVTTASKVVPVYSEGSYGVNAYVVGTDVYVLSKYNIKATSCYYMFRMSEITNITFNNLDTSNVADMSMMFQNCRALTNIDLSYLDTSNVTNMGSMFQNCRGLTSIDLTPLDTNNVTNMFWMFYNCTGLTSIDLTGLDTSNVIDMQGMFYYCRSLTNLDLSSFDTSKVTSMNAMFAGCSELQSIDLSSFNTIRVTNMRAMFSNCKKLVTIYVDDGFYMPRVTISEDMFNNCTSLVGGNGTVYDSTKVDKTYARIDKIGRPGYFTLKTE